MIQITFRVEKTTRDKGKKKAGLLGLSIYLRTLLAMWLANEIRVTEADIVRHGG